MKTTVFFLLGALLLACSQPQPVDDRAARNKERITQFYAQLVNAHNAEMVDTFFSADIMDHQDALTVPVKGIENVKNGFKEFFSTFPNAHLQAHFLVAEGDTVVAKLTMTGTNTGSLKGGPATGKSININGTAVFVLKDGKITERWRNFDDLLMMQQLGMMPGRPDSAAASK